MRFLFGRAARSAKVRPRAPFERRLRAVEFVVLGMGIFVMAIFVSSVRYEKSVLRAEEAARKQDCFVLASAIEQYTLDKHSAPESLDDLIRSKYLSTVPVDPVTREKLSLPACVAGSEDYMDPVETIPGFRHLYSYSTDTSGKGSYF